MPLSLISGFKYHQSETYKNQSKDKWYEITSNFFICSRRADSSIMSTDGFNKADSSFMRGGAECLVILFSAVKPREAVEVPRENGSARLLVPSRCTVETTLNPQCLIRVIYAIAAAVEAPGRNFRASNHTSDVVLSPRISTLL